jgi:hypothetical protein
MELLARFGRHRDLLVLYAARQASPTAPPLVGDQLERLSSAVERAEAALGEGPAAAARAQGRGMTDDQAVAFARALLGDGAGNIRDGALYGSVVEALLERKLPHAGSGP